jgi:hypothetical protein
VSPSCSGQIKHLKDGNGAQQIDRVAVERSVKLAAPASKGVLHRQLATLERASALFLRGEGLARAAFFMTPAMRPRLRMRCLA